MRINPGVLFGFLPMLSLIMERELQGLNADAAQLPDTISATGSRTVEHSSLAGEEINTTANRAFLRNLDSFQSPRDWNINSRVPPWSIYTFF